jgi:hypothetical protein
MQIKKPANARNVQLKSVTNATGRLIPVPAVTEHSKKRYKIGKMLQISKNVRNVKGWLRR